MNKYNVTSILEVREATEAEAQNSCNSCFNGKCKIAIKVGYNNQGMNIRLCRECYEKLSQKMWDIDLPLSEKSMSVVYQTTMVEIPKNCVDCTLINCGLPLNDEGTFSNSYRSTRHPRCPLIEVVKHG